MSTLIHLDELIGLCDEISALSKAGLPLEKSLSQRQKDAFGERLRKMVPELEKGTSAADLIRRDSDFPTFYAVVLESGLASGNLSGVLDTVAASARQIRDVRLFVVRTTLYPMILFTLLWFALVGIFLVLAPIYFSFYESMHFRYFPVQILEWIENCSRYRSLLILGPPVLAWIAYGLWGYSTKRSDIFRSSRTPFRLIPLLGTAVAELQKVVFAKNLALLIQASVPWDRAVSLASRSCGVSEEKYSCLLQWSRGTSEPHLSRGLQVVAENAQLRADLATAHCETFFPVFSTILVAIALGFAYFIVIVCPYIEIIRRLSSPLTQ